MLQTDRVAYRIAEVCNTVRRQSFRIDVRWSEDGVAVQAQHLPSGIAAEWTDAGADLSRARCHAFRALARALAEEATLAALAGDDERLTLLIEARSMAQAEAVATV